MSRNTTSLTEIPRDLHVLIYMADYILGQMLSANSPLLFVFVIATRLANGTAWMSVATFIAATAVVNIITVYSLR